MIPHRPRASLTPVSRLDGVDALLATQRPRGPVDPYWDWLATHARPDSSLGRLWAMTPAQRVAAMRRGELTDTQLAAWREIYPEQIPHVNGLPEWLAATAQAA